MGIENFANPPELPDSLKRLMEEFPNGISEAGLVHGDASAVAESERLLEIMGFLKRDPRLLFDVLVDLTAVDYLGREPRFEVVYHLLSLPLNHRLRLKVRLAGTKPRVASVNEIWPSANWLEREAWDMFGIEFTGHPDLKRILLYPEFEGHPLRKDYPVRRRQPLVGPKN
jgi:NADH-quinone oxidoreductase subunit C